MTALRGREITWKRHPSPARNKPPRMGEEASCWRHEGCRDSNEQLAREAMSSSSSGIAVSVSESAWSWSLGPLSRRETCHHLETIKQTEELRDSFEEKRRPSDPAANPTGLSTFKSL